MIVLVRYCRYRYTDTLMLVVVCLQVVQWLLHVVSTFLMQATSFYSLYIFYFQVCTSCANISIGYQCLVVVAGTLRVVLVCLLVVQGYCTLLCAFYMQVIALHDLYIFYFYSSTSCAIISSSQQQCVGTLIVVMVCIQVVHISCTWYCHCTVQANTFCCLHLFIFIFFIYFQLLLLLFW